MKLFTGGKLKISGNIMASQKLDVPAKDRSREGQRGGRQSSCAGEGPAAAAAAQSVGSGRTRGQRAGDLRGAQKARLADKPELVAEVKANMFHFKVTDPDAAMDVDAQGRRRKRQPGGREVPTTTITIADEDSGRLVKGEATAEALFQRGKLRVDGDIFGRAPSGFSSTGCSNGLVLRVRGSKRHQRITNYRAAL